MRLKGHMIEWEKKTKRTLNSSKIIKTNKKGKKLQGRN